MAVCKCYEPSGLVIYIVSISKGVHHSAYSLNNRRVPRHRPKLFGECPNASYICENGFSCSDASSRTSGSVLGIFNLKFKLFRISVWVIASEVGPLRSKVLTGYDLTNF